MKKIDEHYYIITEDEITKEMVPVGNGLFLIGEDFYEISDDAKIKLTAMSNAVTSRPITNRQVVSSVSDNSNTNFTALFVFSVLLLAFAVLCFYLGINYLDAYGKANDINNQVSGLISSATKQALRNGILWFLGGVASISVGIVLAVKYNNKK